MQTTYYNLFFHLSCVDVKAGSMTGYPPYFKSHNPTRRI